MKLASVVQRLEEEQARQRSSQVQMFALAFAELPILELAPLRLA